MKPKLLLLIGPTAVGKSSLLEKALADFPQLRDVITYTTRAPRPGESEGHPYHFVTEERFKELIQQNFFLEWAYVHGRMYGTPRDQIVNLPPGMAAIMDIDVQGAKKLKAEFPEAVAVFLMPPSIDALRQRFVNRGWTDEEDLAKRLESARTEMAQAQDFDVVLVNEDLDETYGELRKIIEKLLRNQ